MARTPRKLETVTDAALATGPATDGHAVVWRNANGQFELAAMASGGGGFGQWTFDSTTTLPVDAATLGSGNVRLSDDPKAVSLSLYIHATNSHGVPMGSAIAALLDVGDLVYLQINGKGELYELTGAPVDNTGWYSATMVHLAGAPVALANGDEVSVVPLTKRASFATISPGTLADLNEKVVDATFGGLQVGDFFTLVNTAGGPGLPIVDGSNLTNVTPTIADDSIAVRALAWTNLDQPGVLLWSGTTRQPVFTGTYTQSPGSVLVTNGAATPTFRKLLPADLDPDGNSDGSTIVITGGVPAWGSVGGSIQYNHYTGTVDDNATGFHPIPDISAVTPAAGTYLASYSIDFEIPEALQATSYNFTLRYSGFTNNVAEAEREIHAPAKPAGWSVSGNVSIGFRVSVHGQGLLTVNGSQTVGVYMARGVGSAVGVARARSLTLIKVA